MAENQAKISKQTNDILARVAGEIRKSENVLIALSKDPSVDELAAAIGLTMMLDDIGKHATAIFSGEVPNALEFLEPEKTLEKDTNSLQDFIIALNKEKADHLRYKIEGDYVKVFITPYRATIDESDLEFSHGDFNVDLVITIDVESTNDLDAALYEHGRIMHNASAINISAGLSGNFGDIQWSDPGASSVSEMICELEVKLRGDGNNTWLTQATATAFLTGIVAATGRFSNEKTSASAMAWAGKLMEAGADQQMISANIMKEILPNEKKAEPEQSEKTIAETLELVDGMKIGTADAPVGGASAVDEGANTPVKTEDPSLLNIERSKEPLTKEPLMSAPSPGAIIQGDEPLISELISPGFRGDSEQKNYSEEMARELGEANEAPTPVELVPEMNEQTELPSPGIPINYSQGPMGEMPAIVAPVPGAMIVPEIPNGELVEAPLPMPTEGLLPPPPPPFDPNQQFTSDNVPVMPIEPVVPVAPVMPAPVMSEPMTEDVAVTGMLAEASPEINTQVQNPVDPGAFKIPGA